MKQFLIFLSLPLFILLAGCAGFQPLHGSAGAQTVFSNMNIDVRDGGDEGDRLASFTIRQRLVERINPGTEPDYQLTVTPNSRRVGIGLTGQDFATRFDGVVTADWQLVRRADGGQVAKGRARSVTTYSADQDPYRLQTSADQATQRAARDVADQLLQQISLELTALDLPENATNAPG